MDSMNECVTENQHAVESMNVLLVDDDAIDRERIAKMLKEQHRYDYQITVAANYEEALPCLENEVFDVCLIDYYLGSHIGLELLEKVNISSSMSSVIMLTGADSEEIDEESLQAGVADFLSKNTLTAKLLDRSIRYATHHKKLSIEYERLAHYDDLTKLVNRSLFFDRLTHLITQSYRHHREHALLYIDLDYFKNINDAHGYAVGDTILQMFADRLLQSVRSLDTVARLGGDEFAIILEEITPEDTQQVAQKLLKKMAVPFVVDSLALEINASIGIAFFPYSTSQNPNTILEQADQALYHAKKLGRKRYCYFDNQLRKFFEEKTTLGQELRSAIQNRQIYPHYQPQYSLRKAKIEAFEALARWQRSDNELVFPQQFIEHAEQLNIMPALTEAMIKQACIDLEEWTGIDPDIKVAINISTSDSVNDYLLQVIKNALKEHEIHANQLELEFDASALITQPDETIEILNKLSNLGVSITINNFGKGDISLWSLAELSINTIKIDMSLIHGIGVSLPKEIIVKVILDMAKQFSLKTVAVGVETKEQADFLSRYGCDNVQGYLYSRPLSHQDTCKMLRE